MPVREGHTNLESIFGKLYINVLHHCIHGASLDSVILTKVVQRLWKITPELNLSLAAVVGRGVIPKDKQSEEPVGGIAPQTSLVRTVSRPLNLLGRKSKAGNDTRARATLRPMYIR